MFPRARLRLLWILLLMPMLSVLGLDLHRVHHAQEETVERATPVTPQAVRRETGKLNPGQSSKTSPQRLHAGLHLQPALALSGPSAADLAPVVAQASVRHDSVKWSPWQPRGPPSAI